jgi:hypothetical protein
MKTYSCIDCGTGRYIIFPLKDITFRICSVCYRIREQIAEDKVNEINNFYGRKKLIEEEELPCN